MALTAASMKAKIRAAMAAVPPPAANTAEAALAYSDALVEALCQGIIEELTQNGVVTIASVSGVQTGGGVSGPGTGTIT